MIKMIVRALCIHIWILEKQYSENELLSESIVCRKCGKALIKKEDFATIQKLIMGEITNV